MPKRYWFFAMAVIAVSYASSYAIDLQLVKLIFGR